MLWEITAKINRKESIQDFTQRDFRRITFYPYTHIDKFYKGN